MKNWADTKHVFLIGINKGKSPGTTILKVVAWGERDLVHVLDYFFQTFFNLRRTYCIFTPFIFLVHWNISRAKHLAIIQKGSWISSTDRWFLVCKSWSALAPLFIFDYCFCLVFVCGVFVFLAMFYAAHCCSAIGFEFFSNTIEYCSLLLS